MGKLLANLLNTKIYIHTVYMYYFYIIMVVQYDESVGVCMYLVMTLACVLLSILLANSRA